MQKQSANDTAGALLQIWGNFTSEAQRLRLCVAARVDDVSGQRSLPSRIGWFHNLRDACGSAAVPTCAVDSVFNGRVIAAGQLRLSNLPLVAMQCCQEVAFLNQKQECCAQYGNLQPIILN